MESQLGSRALLLGTLPARAPTCPVTDLSCNTLRLVLGDQLNAAHSWFDDCDDDTLYVIAELHQEAAYVRHHVQKIAAFFLAMAAFAGALRERGHRVLYLDLDDTAG
ncbi:MAG: hypothetical protein HKN58_06010, partial [Xanthomonadales bacterium]|nr:hypothetical protein [Xanthomonadales bacterium]